MTVCRHGLHNGVIAYMLQFCYSSIHITFEAWVVNVKAIISWLDLKPDDGFLYFFKNA